MRERKYILAQYDISGIQDYIFATNRLRENVGASYNVNRILNLFLPDAINEAVKTEGGFALMKATRKSWLKCYILAEAMQLLSTEIGGFMINPAIFLQSR